MTRPIASFTESEQTMIALLEYPNPEGLHPNESRWRDVARKLVARLGTTPEELARREAAAGIAAPTNGG